MKRVLTALLLIPLAVFVNFFAPPPAVWIALAAVSLLCLWEFFALAETMGMRPFRVAGCGAAAVWILTGGLPRPAFAAAAAAVLMLLALSPRARLEDAFGSVAGTLFGIVYIGGAFAAARELHQFNPHWLFLVLLLNWVGDSAAYYVGKTAGRTKLAPRLSPNKTWEGAAASTIVAAAAGIGYLSYFEPASMSWVEQGALALAVNIAGQLGDLAESGLKRGAGIKDSGTLLPGHGGMLDRLDGVLFSLPAAYFFLVLFG